jgi:hypothetical protein
MAVGSSVPSEIVAYLEARFPQTVKEQPFYLERAYAPALSHILQLIDALPVGIVTLTGDALAEYGESVEAVRMALDAWRSGDTNHYKFEKIRGRHSTNPLTFIHKHLSSLPDEVIAPGTTDLPFITDTQFKEALRLDIAAANRSYGVADWKGCTVLSGSVVEALLLWALDQRETKKAGEAPAAAKKLVTASRLGQSPSADRNRWNLNELTEVCHQMQIIGDETAAQCRIAREFRNLIHPGKAARLAQRCNRGTALSALAAVEHVVEDLS